MRCNIRTLLTLGTLAVLAACSSSSPPPPPPPPAPAHGSLQLTIQGLPSSWAANVKIIDELGASQTLTTSQTVDLLSPGTYRLEARPVTNGVTTYNPSSDTSSFTIASEHTTAATVAYAIVRGALRVDISGLPAGTDANVDVAGPENFHRILTASQLLSGLLPGNYTITNHYVIGALNIYESGSAGSEVSVSSGVTIVASVAYSADTAAGLLRVTLSGMPEGSDANVVVTGPGGYRQTIHSTQLLNVTAGVYSVRPMPIRVSDTIVDKSYIARAYTTPVFPALTSDVLANYAVNPASGKLWVSTGSDFQLAGYDGSQLASSGSPDPRRVVDPHMMFEYIAVDARGNLWVTNIGDDSVEEFSPDQLAGFEGTTSPIVKITGAADSLVLPSGLAFDQDGNLWIAVRDVETQYHGRVVRFSASQLLSSGEKTPDVIISGADYHPFGLAFDSEHNLWVTNPSSGEGPSLIVKYKPEQLRESGSPTPDVVLVPEDVPLTLAFDALGNLWVASETGRNLSKYTPAQLERSGAPIAAVILTSHDGSLDYPRGLAFDNTGTLWVVSGYYGNPSFNEVIEGFSPSQLRASGQPAPAVTISLAHTILRGGCAFNPPPANLPLYH